MTAEAIAAEQPAITRADLRAFRTDVQQDFLEFKTGVQHDIQESEDRLHRELQHYATKPILRTRSYGSDRRSVASEPTSRTPNCGSRRSSAT